MNIVYLDAQTVNPDQIDLTSFNTLGDFKIYRRTPPELIVERAKEADAVLINKVGLSREILLKLPKLKYVGITATGYNIIDLPTANELGIIVSNAKNYSSMSVAQQTFAMILAFSNRLSEHSDPVRWTKTPDFCYFDFPLQELKDKTLGLIGFGDIGKKVAQIAAAFEMKILVSNRSQISNDTTEIQQVELDELLKSSDFISLHVPLSVENHEFMNKGVFLQMKKNAVLINTARGLLVNERDLADALNLGIIGGAYLDVVSEEPPKVTNPLFSARNCKISPHIAWATIESRTRLMQIVFQNLQNFINGGPSSVVS